MLMLSQQAFATTYCTDASIGACWLMNDTSGNLADSSGKANTLTSWYGTATYSATGQFGTAITLNNSPFYNSSGTSIQVSLPITLTVWLKPASVTANQVIYSNAGMYGGSTGAQNGVWMFLNSSGQVQCGFGDGGGSGSSHQQIATTTSSLTNSTYTHVACVIQGSSNIQIYFNGSSQSVSNAGSGGSISYSGGGELYTTIGRDAYGNYSSTMTATYDELAQFDRALSSTEISNIMNNGLQSNESAGGTAVNSFFGDTF